MVYMNNAYKINLEVFNGPLDLLLYLISKEEVDIYDIPIAKIVDQYMQYLQAMREENMEVSGDFLVMSATLMVIKSRMLLPTEEVDLEEEIDPRDELVLQLLEYKKYKIISRELGERARDQSRRQGRPLSQEPVASEAELPLDEVSLWDLVKAFTRILDDTGGGWGTTIVHSEKPISAYIEEILAALEKSGKLTLRTLVESVQTLHDAIGLFVGLLELTRLSVVKLIQPESTGELEVELEVDREQLAEFTPRNLDALLLDEDDSESEALWREKVQVDEQDRAAGEALAAASSPKEEETPDAGDVVAGESTISDAFDGSDVADAADLPAPVFRRPAHKPAEEAASEEGGASG